MEVDEVCRMLLGICIDYIKTLTDVKEIYIF